MGVESQGMLLVRGEAPDLELLEMPKASPGDSIS